MREAAPFATMHIRLDTGITVTAAASLLPQLSNSTPFCRITKCQCFMSSPLTHTTANHLLLANWTLLKRVFLHKWQGKSYHEDARQSGYKTLGYIRRVKYNVAHQSAVKPEKGDPGSIDKVQRAIPRWQGVSHLFERETDADPEWNRAFLAGWGKRVSSGSGSTHTRERERGGMKKVSKVLYPTLLLRFLLSPA